jgi:hypothetical protein
MDPLAILLYCQGMCIVLPNMNMAHIVFIAKNPIYCVAGRARSQRASGTTALSNQTG